MQYLLPTSTGRDDDRSPFMLLEEAIRDAADMDLDCAVE